MAVSEEYAATLRELRTLQVGVLLLCDEWKKRAIAIEMAGPQSGETYMFASALRSCGLELELEMQSNRGCQTCGRHQKQCTCTIETLIKALPDE